MFDEALQKKVDDAIESIARLFRQGRKVVCSSSFGKDSSVMTALAIRALEKVMSEGMTPRPLWVASMDTLVENPMMAEFMRAEMAKVKAYGEANNLPIKTMIAAPSTGNNYLVNMIGGRLFASMPNQSSACSDMMKVQTVRSMKRKLVELTGGEKEHVVSLIGKRFDESEERRANMEARGERFDEPVKNEQGEWIMSPIANFTLDDVFYFIGAVRNESFPTYSDFDELVEVYRNAQAGECMVTAYVTGRSNKSGCGARTGCWICLRSADDKSMQNMLQEENNQWMVGLNKLRNFIGHYHDHPKARNWLARSVDDEGAIMVGPGAYSPKMCQDILRYALTLDVREQEAAILGGFEPRFQTLRPEDIIAISMLHARYGYQDPLMACREWYEIYIENKRYDVPDVPQEKRAKLGKWDPVRVMIKDTQFDDLFSGLRDISLATIDQEPIIEKENGTYYAFETGEQFSVDPEAASLYLDHLMGLEEDLEKMRPGTPPSEAFFLLARKGMVNFHPGSHHTQDAMLRLSNAIHRHGLRDKLDDPMALIAELGPALPPREKKKLEKNVTEAEQGNVERYDPRQQQISLSLF